MSWLIAIARTEGKPTPARYRRLWAAYTREHQKRVKAEASMREQAARVEAAEREARVMALLVAKFEIRIQADIATEAARQESIGSLTRKLTG